MSNFRLPIVLILVIPAGAVIHAGQNQNHLKSKDQVRLHAQQALEHLATANPMRKIISMLQDMQKELERESENEATIFEKAMCACEGGEQHLSKIIESAAQQIETLTAKTSAESAEQAGLHQEVKDHQVTLTTTKDDLDQAIALRNKENEQFVKSETEKKRNLQQLGKAIPAIEAGMTGTMFMQQQPHAEQFRRMVEVTKYLSSDDRTTVLAFMDQGSGEDLEEEEHTKTAGAGEIVGILKNINDEMAKDLAEEQATEKRSHEGFNELKAAKEQEVKLNEEAIVTKEKRGGALALSLSEDKHALEDATEEKTDAEKFLATMSETCATKKKERAMRNKMRSEEIAAISEAIKILNDDDALDTFKKVIPSASALMQQKKTYDALLQLKESSSQWQKQGESIKLKNLLHVSLLAAPGESDVEHIYHTEADGVAEAGPAGGVAAYAGEAENAVKKMVDGMVGTLHDEDVSDEHKKEWCANETIIATKLEKEKTIMIAQLDADISQMTDQVAALSDEIKELTEQIQATDKMVHEATQLRKEEHQDFVDTFATMATAIRLLDKAMTRLHKFYNPQKYEKEKKAVLDAAVAKSGLSLLKKKVTPSLAVQRLAADGDFDALIQTGFRKTGSRVDPVVIPDTPGKYEKKESGGVMSIMENFKTDLKMDMTEAETEEKFAAKDYTRVMSEAKETRATDLKSKNQKEAAKATLEQKLVESKELRIQTDKELHNLQLYLVQLHTECDFLLRNFEVRHDGRVSEEHGLEEAETIVTHADVPSHTQIEKVFKEEHSAEEVHDNWPHGFGFPEPAPAPAAL